MSSVHTCVLAALDHYSFYRIRNLVTHSWLSYCPTPQVALAQGRDVDSDFPTLGRYEDFLELINQKRVLVLCSIKGNDLTEKSEVTIHSLVGKTLVGTLVAKLVDGLVVELECFCVQQEERGTGVGKTMLNTAFKLLNMYKHDPRTIPDHHMAFGDGYRVVRLVAIGYSVPALRLYKEWKFRLNKFYVVRTENGVWIRSGAEIVPDHSPLSRDWFHLVGSVDGNHDSYHVFFLERVFDEESSILPK
eukprot:TRINITY_DN15082_c0_g1_i1.p1 TRINITY_DN15082_c0_g1~~TRINITY_DN15082_c0_g1_i1.p1  ORF type:complete len:264 (-),score=36.16 TRINITY_DN15082_c0_g1_i1:26-763(-)